MQNENKTTLFIALNCKDPSVIPIWWLKDCLPPLCMYQIFGDQYSNISNTVVYPSRLIQSGYRNFGYRGRFQMDWAVANFDFDWFLRVDEDGYLCIDSLLHTLYHESAPKQRFFFGRFYCRKEKARADENFLLMSSDVIRYFTKGWNKFLIAFNGQI